MDFFRHQLGRRLRRTLCVLIAGAMAMAPVLSTAAASHEVTHALAVEHHFHDAEQGHSHVTEDDMSDAGGMLHGLTHAVHACAHALAILSGAPPVVGASGDVVLSPDLGAPPGDAPSAHPFRPPIA